MVKKSGTPTGRLSRHCICNWKECRKWQEIMSYNQHTKSALPFSVRWGCPYLGPAYRAMLRRHLLEPGDQVASNEDAAKGDDDDDEKGETTTTITTSTAASDEKGETAAKITGTASAPTNTASTASESDAETTKKKQRWKRLSAESTNLLDETATGGHVARLHYTDAQINILVSMKRGSSGISYDQAESTCYLGIVLEEDRILGKRSRDKEYVERYYVTPSMPKAVVAKEILGILEPQYHAAVAVAAESNTPYTFDEQLMLDTAKAAGEECKWRVLFAERESARKDEEISRKNKEIAELKGPEMKKNYRVMNSALHSRIESLEEQLESQKSANAHLRQANFNLDAWNKRLAWEKRVLGELKKKNDMQNNRITTLEKELQKTSKNDDGEVESHKQIKTLELQLRLASKKHDQEVKSLHRAYSGQVKGLQRELANASKLSKAAAIVAADSRKRLAEKPGTNKPSTEAAATTTAKTTTPRQPIIDQQDKAPHTSLNRHNGPQTQLPLAAFPFPPPPGTMMYPRPATIRGHFMYPGIPPSPFQATHVRNILPTGTGLHAETEPRKKPEQLNLADSETMVAVPNRKTPQLATNSETKSLQEKKDKGEAQIEREKTFESTAPTIVPTGAVRSPPAAAITKVTGQPGGMERASKTSNNSCAKGTPAAAVMAANSKKRPAEEPGTNSPSTKKKRRTKKCSTTNGPTQPNFYTQAQVPAAVQTLLGQRNGTPTQRPVAVFPFPPPPGTMVYPHPAAIGGRFMYPGMSPPPLQSKHTSHLPTGTPIAAIPARDAYTIATNNKVIPLGELCKLKSVSKSNNNICDNAAPAATTIATNSEKRQAIVHTRTTATIVTPAVPARDATTKQSSSALPTSSPTATTTATTAVATPLD